MKRLRQALIGLGLVCVAQFAIILWNWSCITATRETSYDLFRQQDPIWLAAEYESPIAYFERIVKENPGLLNLRRRYEWTDEATAGPPLAELAAKRMTNHADVLLLAGEDPASTIAWCEAAGFYDDAQFVRDRVSALGLRKPE